MLVTVRQLRVQEIRSNSAVAFQATCRKRLRLPEGLSKQQQDLRIIILLSDTSTDVCIRPSHSTNMQVHCHCCGHQGKGMSLETGIKVEAIADGCMQVKNHPSTI